MLLIFFFVVVVVFALFFVCLFFFALSYCVSSRSEFRVVMSYAISVKEKLCSVRLYLQLFVGGRMSYLRYLCLFVYVLSITYYAVVFCFIFLRLVYPMLPVSLDCPFWLPLRYSLTFIQIITKLYF